MGTLATLGKILALISGILAIVFGISGLLNSAIDQLSQLNFIATGQSTTTYILQIIMGVLLIVVYLNKIEIKDLVVLGIVVIVIGLLGGGIISVLGGILIILDKVLK